MNGKENRHRWFCFIFAFLFILNIAWTFFLWGKSNIEVKNKLEPMRENIASSEDETHDQVDFKGELNDCIDDHLQVTDIVSKLREIKKSYKTTEIEKLQDQLLQEKKYPYSLPRKKRRKKMETTQIYQKLKHSVLMIVKLGKCKNLACKGNHARIATGVLLTKDGKAITNYHVMENEKYEMLAAVDFDRNVYLISEVLASNKVEDLALIQLEGKGFRPAPLSFQSQVGTTVTVISHPKNRYYCLTQGVLSRHFKRKVENQKVERITITADFAKGSSGAPVFNDFGQVIGIAARTTSIYAKNKESRNLQMVFKECVPSKSILKLFKKNNKLLYQ